MKATNFLYLLFLMLLVYGCGPRSKPRTGPHNVIILEMDTVAYASSGSSSSSNINELSNRIMHVITSRLVNIGINKDSMEISRNNSIIKDSNKNNLITVKLWHLKEQNVSLERVCKVLQASAKLSFWETYENTEIYPTLVQANKVLVSILCQDSGIAKNKDVDTDTLSRDETTDSKSHDSAGGNTLSEQIHRQENESIINNDTAIANLKKRNPLLFYLHPSVEMSQDGHGYVLTKGPVVGTASISDTGIINNYLHRLQIAYAFPMNLRFFWTIQPFDKERRLLQLVAIKVTTSNGTAPLSGDIITDAHKDFLQGSPDPSISFTMTPQAAQVWTLLTAENIGKSIAIVLDNKVCSFPVVLSKITGGKCSITGHFTTHEVDDFVAMLDAGSMPVPVRIVKNSIEQ